jgi:plastocyanin
LRFTKGMRAASVLASAAVVAALLTSGCGSGGVAPSPAGATPQPSSPVAPRATDGATVSITAAGFDVRELHIVQGSRLTFVNRDIVPHDIESDPFHVHTDCPPLNAVGFLTPGQSRASDPLDTIRTCGFHSHDFEGNEAFHGFVSVEAR